MNISIALGFYVRNAEAMDVLDSVDFEELDMDGEKWDYEPSVCRLLEMIPLADRELIRDLKIAVSEDWELLNNLILNELKVKLELGGALIARTKRIDWNPELSLVFRDGRSRRRQNSSQIGWWWITRDHTKYIDVWIWSKGGRAAERKLADILRNLIPEEFGPVQTAEKLGRDWDSGCLRLASINLSAMVGEDFQLDLDEAKAPVMSCLDWCRNQETVKSVLRLL